MSLPRISVHFTSLRNRVDRTSADTLRPQVPTQVPWRLEPSPLDGLLSLRCRDRGCIRKHCAERQAVLFRDLQHQQRDRVGNREPHRAQLRRRPFPCLRVDARAPQCQPSSSSFPICGIDAATTRDRAETLFDRAGTVARRAGERAKESRFLPDDESGKARRPRAHARPRPGSRSNPSGNAPSR